MVETGCLERDDEGSRAELSHNEWRGANMSHAASPKVDLGKMARLSMAIGRSGLGVVDGSTVRSCCYFTLEVNDAYNFGQTKSRCAVQGNS